MARSRNIKPAFFDNDILAEIEPLGRLFFIGLWTIADCNGNFEWRALKLKAKLLPYDNCNTEVIAIKLDKSGFIRMYTDGTKIYGNVVNFHKHQNPHKNERLKGSDIPIISAEARQAIDLDTLTINRDKSRLIPNDYCSNRADSLILIPDSPILKPDSLNPIKKTNALTLDFSQLGFNDNQIDDLKRIRKANKGTKLTQRIVDALGKEFLIAKSKGFTFDQLLTEWEVRGWKSFKADWVDKKLNTKKSAQPENFQDKDYGQPIVRF